MYAGDLDYEREYLSAYAASPDSVFVLAQAGQEIVGASTGLPLLDDSEAFRQPFLSSAIEPADVFYFGESVLVPHWRGKRIGHAFFDAREHHARSLGRFRWTAFAAVDRSQDDARRPLDYLGNEMFWHKRGYTRQAGMTMQLDWNEIDRGEIGHALTFWTRPLNAATSEHSE